MLISCLINEILNINNRIFLLIDNRIDLKDGYVIIDENYGNVDILDGLKEIKLIEQSGKQDIKEDFVLKPANAKS